MLLRKRLVALFVGSNNEADFVAEAKGRRGVLELWESESVPGSHYVRFYYSFKDEFPEYGGALITEGCFRTTRGTLEVDGMMIAIESNHRYEFMAIPKHMQEADGVDGLPER